MSLVIDPSIFLSGTVQTLRNPCFLWSNMVSVDAGIAADSEDPDHPASNLGNPQTPLYWKSLVTTDQNIDLTVSPTTPIDAFGIARHNLGSQHAVLQVWGQTAEVGAVMTLLFEMSPGDDSPVMGVLTPGYYTTIRIRIVGPDAAPMISVVYVGTMIRMPIGVPPGHTPLFDALEISTINSLAESGDFLDEIITSQILSSDISVKQIPGDFFRSSIRPFVRSRRPFFYARSPLLHPTECVYAKFTTSPKPVINQSQDWYDLSMSLTGLAL
jgi:hypothetical protein